jgi:hypothetical protein
VKSIYISCAFQNPILHLPLDEVIEMRSHETNITPFGDNFPKFVKLLADITCFGAAYVVAKTEIPKSKCLYVKSNILLAFLL